MGFTVKHHHHRLRREVLNPYFSKANVLRLEDRIKQCVNRLCERLDEYRVSQKPVNLTVAYLALSTDVITAYSFRKSLDMLEKPFSSQWKDTITLLMQNTSFINQFSWLPRLVNTLPAFLLNRLPGLPGLSAFNDLKKV